MQDNNEERQPWADCNDFDFVPAGVGEFEFVDVQVNGQVILCTPADKINWVEASAWRRSN